MLTQHGNVIFVDKWQRNSKADLRSPQQIQTFVPTDGSSESLSSILGSIKWTEARVNGKYTPVTQHFPKLGNMAKYSESSLSIIDLSHLGKNLSDYQKVILTEIFYGRNNLLVSAVAGAGKTTTMELGFKLIPSQRQRKTRYIAFNAHIKDELVRRGLPAKTLHGEGFTVWRKEQGSEVSLQIDKLTKLCFALWGKQTPITKIVRKTVAAAKVHGLVPKGLETKGLVPDTDASWYNLMQWANIDSLEIIEKHSQKMIEMSRTLLMENINEVLKIDFSDMLYLPYIYDSRYPIYETLFVDEAQDLSPLQHEVLGKMIGPDSQLVAIGDPYQSIYAFTGADPLSMTRLSKRFDCLNLPLSVTYRCPRSHVEVAQRLVPEITAGPTATEGQIEVLREWKPENLFLPGDIVLCRKNKPLVKLAFKCLRQKIKVIIKGNDIYERLLSIFQSFKTDSVTIATDKLQMWYEKLIEATDDDNTIQYYTDLYETARVFLEEATSDKLAEVIDGIKLIYNDQALADGVTLSTVHKAKGLEAKRVFILAPYEFGRAKIDDVINAQQERNIEYVALTRSKEYLGILM